MFIRIERSSGIPILRQVIEQIRAQCASGALKEGDRLPSVRVLAKELAVNQNTILHVYENLAAEGLLEMRHGDGTFVAKGMTRPQIRAQHEALRQEIERVVERAAALGLTLEEFVVTAEEAFETRLPQSNHAERRK